MQVTISNILLVEARKQLVDVVQTALAFGNERAHVLVINLAT
eukprot:COSAG01_NODE_3505_length_5993_cov_5.816763_4_plen_42_part_00